MKSLNVFVVKNGFEHMGSATNPNYGFTLNKNIFPCNWYLLVL